MIYLILQHFIVNPNLRRIVRSSLAEPRVYTVTFHRVALKEDVDGSFQHCLALPLLWIARRNFSFRRANRTRKVPTWPRHTWCFSRYVLLEIVGVKKRDVSRPSQASFNDQIYLVNSNRFLCFFINSTNHFYQESWLLLQRNFARPKQRPVGPSCVRQHLRHEYCKTFVHNRMNYSVACFFLATGA